jgi:hypothetical protein
MAARYLFVTIVLFMFVTSCAPPADSGLKKAAGQLKAGMTKVEVAALFHDFEATETTGKQIGIEIVRFQPEAEPATAVIYIPKDTGEYRHVEVCLVFFDAKDVIIGYRYKRS